MSAKRNCKACSELQVDAADFIVNGVTDEVSLSLQNNTGFSKLSGNDDCEDLNNANDCLIGNMEDEVDAHDVCGWKDFMRDFIHNLWAVLKSMIAAICGLWKHVETAECQIEGLLEGYEFKFSEDNTDGDSYIVAGKGVSFLKTGTEEGKSQITLRYIAGGLLRINGTIECWKENFTDERSCVNFDNGSTERTSISRKGNTYLYNTYSENHTMDGESVTFRPVRKLTNGGDLLYEIRLKKSEYPMIKKLFGGNAWATGGGEYHARMVVFEEGNYAYGQHGDCHPDTGVRRSDDHDDGHLVPEGWTYIQLRMNSITHLMPSVANGVHKYTPAGYMGIRLNPSQMICDGSDSGDENEGGSDDEGGD